VHVGGTSGADPVVLQLDRRAGVIEGAVHTPGGQPIPWAHLVGWNGHETVADEHGRFVLAGLEVGRSGPIEVSAEGFAEAREIATARQDPDRPLSVVLDPLRKISGHVVDSNGHPLEDAEIRVVDGLVEIARTVSDRQGAFVIGPVAAGSHRIVAKHEGHATLDRSLDLPDGEGPFDLGTVELSWEQTIRGRVIDGEGLPVPGAEIFALRDFLPRSRRADRRPDRSPDDRSDADGEFEVGELAPGTVTLELWKEGFAPKTVDVELGRSGGPREIEVEMQAARELRVRVVDDHGDPVAGALVLLGVEPPAGDHRLGGSYPPLRTSDAGEVRLNVQAGSTVQIDVIPDRWARAQRALTLPSDPGTTDTTIRLSRPASVDGVVFDPNGEPVRDATVQAWAPEGSLPLAGASTDSGGRFRLDGLAPGRLVLKVDHRGFATSRTPLDLPPGATTRQITLQPRDSATLVGSVLEDGRWPVAGARGSLRSTTTGKAWPFQADGEGVFRIQAIPRGAYEVSLDDGRFLPTADSLLVQVDEPAARATISVARPCRVEGLVSGLGAGQIGNLRVRAVSSQIRLPLPVDPAALVVRGQLPPGHWRIEGTLTGADAEEGATPSATSQVTCESGETVSFELAF